MYYTIFVYKHYIIFIRSDTREKTFIHPVVCHAFDLFELYRFRV